MNVLHISTSGELAGGAEFRLLEIIDEEAKRGIRPVVVLPKEGSLLDELKSRNIECHIVKSFPWIHSPLQNRLIAWAAFKVKQLLSTKPESEISSIIDSSRINLVHINTSVTSLGYKAARKNKVPVVWHVREFNDARKGFEFNDEGLSKRTIGSSDAVVFVSNVLAESYSGFVPTERLHVIYDNAKRPRSHRGKTIFSGDKIKIAVINNICPGKGQMDALVALKDMPDEARRNFEVLFVGRCDDGPYYQDMLSLVDQWDLTDSVRFLPFSEDVYSILHESDIALNCSISEALPGATIEGMMAGCLTIGNDTTGIRELLQDGRGLLYSAEQGKDLASVLMSVCVDADACCSLANVGKAFADTNFQDGAKKLVDLFEQIVR